MSSNHCKIKHRNAYVKVGINGKDLEVFRLKIKDMMPEYEGKLVFCYVDQDGDRILIRNQENFEIFLAENENSKLEIVEDEIPVKRKSESAIDLCSKKLKTDIKIADHSQDFNEVDKSAGLSQDIDKLDENIRTKSDFDGKKHIKKVLRNAKKKSVKPKQGNLDSIETGLQRVSQQNDDTHKSNVKDKADEKSIRDINYLGILNNNLPMLEVKPNLDTKIQEKPSTTSQQLNDNPFLKILDYSKDLYVLSFPFSDNSLITEQILLPTSPTPFKLINYEPVNFLFLISQLIIHLSTKVGLRKTCNFFKIPVDLCLFIRNDIQNTNQSQIKGFYDIFNYLADKDSYKTCKVTPNFCGKIVNDLESQTVSYDQVICDLEVSCFTLDM